jgi:hypothetical protein
VNITASVPGTYTIVAVTSYYSINPSAPAPANTTVQGIFDVPPPTSVTPYAGTGVNVDLGSTVLIQSSVSTALGELGPYAVGTMQENISAFNFSNGVTDPGTGGWYPGPAGPSGSPSVQFNLTDGTLNDAVGIGAAAGNGAFAATAVGSTIDTYTQQLRYSYMITDASTGEHEVVIPLPSLSFTLTKTGANTYSVNAQ